MLSSGEKDERVTFQRRAVDANGDRLGPWEDDIGRFCKITWLKGSEPVIAARLQGVQPAVIQIDEDTETRAIDNTWRAVGVTPRIAGMVFNVKAVSPGKDRTVRDLTVEQNGTVGGP